MPVYIVTESAGPLVAGRENPGAGVELVLTEREAEYDVLQGYLSLTGQPEPAGVPYNPYLRKADRIAIEATAAELADARDDAQTAATLAQQAQAGAATDKNTVATDKAKVAADLALTTAAKDTALSAIAALPHSGTTNYALNALALSPSNGRPYRRNTAGTSATDPALDPTNWRPAWREGATGFPKERPEMNFMLAAMRDFDSDVTFTRNSEATGYFGKTEVAKQNLIANSANFGVSKENADTAPNTILNALGQMKGGVATETTATGSHRVNGECPATGYGNSYVTAIDVAKGLGSAAPDIIQLSITGQSSAYANFDMVNGVFTKSVGTTGGALQLDNGWWRIFILATAENGNTSSGLVLAFCNNDPLAGRLPQYAGNANADVRYSRPAFMEGSKLLPYVETTGTPITTRQPVLEVVPANEPRFVVDPATGKSLGYLPEESVTNNVKNNQFIGIDVGRSTTYNIDGLNVKCGLISGVFTRVLAVEEYGGVKSLLLHSFGTADATAFFNVVANDYVSGVVAGEKYVVSAWVEAVDGFGGSLEIYYHQRDATDAISYQSSSPSLGATGWKRNDLVTEIVATTTTLKDRGVYLKINAGETVNRIWRVGGLQCTKGGRPFSLIRTSGAAATKAADVAYIEWPESLAAAFSVAAVCPVSNFAAGEQKWQRLWEVGKYSSNRIYSAIRAESATDILTVNNTVANSDRGLTYGNAVTGGRSVHIASLQDGDVKGIKNGDVMKSVPAGVVISSPNRPRLYIGSDSNGTQQLNAPIELLRVYRGAISDAEMYALQEALA